MEEKMEKLYQEYLKEKLDLIFDIDYRKIEKKINDEHNKKREIKLTLITHDKCNFIDEQGNYISKQWFDKADEFHEGFAIIVINGRCNFIDEQGKYISREWYHNAKSFHEGYAVVKKNGKYNYINKNGKLLSETWYDEAWNFNEDFAVVKMNNKYNFINLQGKILCSSWYDDAGKFKNGYAFVENNGKKNYLTRQGELVSEKWYNEMVRSGSTFHAKNKLKKQVVIFIRREENRPSLLRAEKTLTGKYKCYTTDGEFKVKYRPLESYDLDYLLCYYDEKFYLYNIHKDQYEELGQEYNVSYHDNIILADGKTWLIYEGKKINIPESYMITSGHLINKGTKIIHGINIMTREEFDELNIEEKEKFLKEEKENNKKIKERQLKEKQEEELSNAQKQKEQERENNNREFIETLKALKENINKLNSLKSKVGNIKAPRVTVENLFTEVDNHREVMSELKDKLEFIDLSTISFKNVDVSGMDFKGCNINLYPQEVYKKNLKGCDFTGVNISPFIDFRGADIRGAKFSADNDITTLDVMPKFTGAIYDENTTYNGKSLVDILGPCEEIKESNRRAK